MASNEVTQKDVVIIGAGLCGLIAALDLKKQAELRFRLLVTIYFYFHAQIFINFVIKKIVC